MRDHAGALQFAQIWDMPATSNLDRVRIASLAGQPDGVAPLAAGRSWDWDADSDAVGRGAGASRDHFRLTTRRLLGIPLPTAEFLTECRACGQSMADLDAYLRSAHLATCGGSGVGGAGGGYHGPHRAVQVAVRQAFQDAGLEAELEKNDLIQDSAERPGDVAAELFLQAADGVEVLATDVVVSRLQVSSALPGEARRPGRTNRTHEQLKRRRYLDKCAENNVAFVPFALDEFGRLGPSAHDMLQRLASLAASGPHSNYTHGRKLESRRQYWLRRWRTRIAAAVHQATMRVITSRMRHSTRTAEAMFGFEDDSYS
jgi:hypothetical protein